MQSLKLHIYNMKFHICSLIFLIFFLFLIELDVQIIFAIHLLKKKIGSSWRMSQDNTDVI